MTSLLLSVGLALFLFAIAFAINRILSRYIEKRYPPIAQQEWTIKVWKRT